MLLWGIKNEKGKLECKNGVPVLFKTKTCAQTHHKGNYPGCKCQVVMVVVDILGE